jgi:hypothetical protein
MKAKQGIPAMGTPSPYAQALADTGGEHAGSDYPVTVQDAATACAMGRWGVRWAG